MLYRYFIITIACIFIVIGCDRFDKEIISIITPDEVSTFTVSCFKVLGVPTMCIVTDATTKTIRIENIVTNIVDRIVKKEVVTEVPIEKIITRVETRYIKTEKDVDIEEIVVYIIARIKEYVEPSNIIDVPTDEIVHEITDDIVNSPSEENNTPGNSGSGSGDGSTTVRIPDSDNTNGNTNNGGNGNTNNGGNGNTNNGGNGNTNNGGNGNEGITENVGQEKLRIKIGPKAVTTRPSINQPGLSVSVTCNIDGNLIHPRLNSYFIFRNNNRKQWGVEVWCDVPSNLNDADTTIYVHVHDTLRWCGLTSADVNVAKFVQTSEGTLIGRDEVGALIRLDPDPVPVCVIETPDPPDPEPEYLPKQEFFEVYYAILLEDDFLEVQIYHIRGYGYDGETPIYVDNYHKFEGGSEEQTSTGWGPATTPDTIAYHLENGWKIDYPEEFDYVHFHTKVSAHDKTFEEARRELFGIICNTAKTLGEWDGYQVGLTFPEISNNTSDDILNLDIVFLYLDDCDPYN